MKQVKQLQLEISIHAADHVVRHGHADVFGGLGVLPRKIFISKFRKGLGDSDQSAPFLGGTFPPLLGLDGVFLGRALVKRPQVTVDASISIKTLVENLGWAG